MPRRRRVPAAEDGEAAAAAVAAEKSSSSSSDDELEHALDRPRFVAKERIVAGRKVSYTRHLIYAPDEDGGMDARFHDKPLRDKRHDNVSLTGLDQGPVPDPYEEAKYVTMEEHAEAISQFNDFIHNGPLTSIIESRPKHATPAAEARAAERGADLALRRQIDAATRRATVNTDVMLSGDWARIIPAHLVGVFVRDAAPALAILLPYVSRHEDDITHETLASWKDSMANAGCIFAKTVEHEFPGALVPGQHAHVVRGTSRIIELVFRCYFAGDDADEDLKDDTADAADNVAEPTMTTTVQLAVPGAAAGAAAAAAEANPADAAEEIQPHRYKLHVMCHEVGRMPVMPQPEKENAEAKALRETHELILCFRTFYFSR